MSEHENNSKEDGQDEEVTENKSKTPEIAVNPENSDECANSNEKDQAQPFVHRRFKFLKYALDKVIEKCSSAGKFSWYKSHFPTLFKSEPAKLKRIQNQVIQQLGENIRTETKLMLAEENIEKMMNDLDFLIFEAGLSRHSDAWRPTGNVNEDVRAHLMPEKIRFRNNLRELLKNLEEENKKLKELTVQWNRNILKTREKVVEYTAFFSTTMNTTEGIHESILVGKFPVHGQKSES